MKNLRPKPSREAGQGTIEYILVLTVTVILILTVVFQFSTAFRAYSEQIFDGYLACLLETGEMPGGALCSSEMKSFNIADGRSAIASFGSGAEGGGSGAAGGGSSGSGSGGASSGQGDRAGADDKKGNGSGSGSGSGGESAAANGGTSASVGVGNIGSRGKGRSASTAVKGAGTGDEKNADSLLGGIPGMTGVGSTRAEGGRARRTALDRGYGYLGQEQEESEAVARAPTSSIAKTSEGAEVLRPKKTEVQINRKPASRADTSDEGFSLGVLVKYILIAGIIIAIIVFFGGQLLQISKSAEK